MNFKSSYFFIGIAIVAALAGAATGIIIKNTFQEARPPVTPTPIIKVSNVPPPTDEPTPTTALYTCPSTETINCIPQMNPVAGLRKQCEPEYLKWAQAHCPNFKGATY